MSETGIDQWLDTAQVAHRLLIKVTTMRQYASTGRLAPDTYVGRTPLWRPETVERYAAEMHPSGRLARQNRAARETRRVRTTSEDGSAAVCAVCGAALVYRAETTREDGTGDTGGPPGDESRGRWVDREGNGHAH
jgi:predicted RNA-binding Zn-ribbon protein involved in translation (DUF1610 family)